MMPGQKLNRLASAISYFNHTSAVMSHNKQCLCVFALQVYSSHPHSHSVSMHKPDKVNANDTDIETANQNRSLVEI